MLLSLLKRTNVLGIPCGDGCLAIQFVIFELSLGVIRCCMVLAGTMFLILLPLANVLLEFTREWALTRSLAFNHVPNIFWAVCIAHLDFSLDFTINKYCLYFCAVGKLQDSWTISDVINILSFIFEVSIGKMIYALAMSFFGLRVHLTLVDLN